VVKAIRDRFNRWVFGRASRMTKWWTHQIPILHPVELETEKDIYYWNTIAGLLQVKPLLREYRERKDRYYKEMEMLAESDMDDLKRLRMMEVLKAEMRGFNTAVNVLVNANNTYLEMKQEAMNVS